MTIPLRWAPEDRCAWQARIWRVVEVHPVSGVAFVALDGEPLMQPLWRAPLGERELVPFAMVSE